MLYFLNGLVAKTARHSSAKGIRGGANPPQASRHKNARVAELVYAFDLKSNLERDMGSTPIPSTRR